MSGVRAPVVTGIGGGVGTSTLAVALRAHDAGRTHVEIADILACRGTLDSLRRVAAVLDPPGSALPGPPPVLAVTLDGGRLPRGPVRARLEILDAAVSAVVLLPHVARWRTIADPLPEAAQLLVEPAENLPRPLRAYAAALRELVAAVAASGRLRSGPGPTPRADVAGPGVVRSPGSAPRGPVSVSGDAPRVAGALRRVVGVAAPRPVVGAVSRAAVPAAGPPPPAPAAHASAPTAPVSAPTASGAAERVRRPRGVQIVPARSRPRPPTERIEQVG